MNKQEFLARLRDVLQGLPPDDINARLAFYAEMIDDRMEEGLSEAEAVASVGTVDEIFAQIVTEIPYSKIAAARGKPQRRLGTWEIVLLVLGFPLWFSLLAAAFAVVLSLFVSLWSVVVSLWAVFASVVACAFGGLVAFLVFLFGGHTLTGLAMLAAALFLAGLSILTFYGCKTATKGTVLLTRKTLLCIRNCFVKKEGTL